jgi:menaquinone-dependent protoporphyrinogen IX oxidase
MNDAELRPVESVKSLDGYQAVVLGSSIPYGAWLPEMLKMIEARRGVLSRLPVAILTLHRWSSRRWATSGIGVRFAAGPMNSAMRCR